MRHAVIVHDPEGREPEGEVISGNAIGVAAARGVVLLPVEIDVLRRGGVSGWSKRVYGRGWQYDAIAAARGCPLVLHISPAYPLIVWVARVQADPAGSLSGSLRLAPDTAQVGAGAIGLAPESSSVQLQTLGPPDAEGGWIISGRARASIPGDMFLALQLYGQVGGARVLWFAASQTR
jgi:hypothetical protein